MGFGVTHRVQTTFAAPTHVCSHLEEDWHVLKEGVVHKSVLHGTQSAGSVGPRWTARFGAHFRSVGWEPTISLQDYVGCSPNPAGGPAARAPEQTQLGTHHHIEQQDWPCCQRPCACAAQLLAPSCHTSTQEPAGGGRSRPQGRGGRRAQAEEPLHQPPPRAHWGGGPWRPRARCPVCPERPWESVAGECTDRELGRAVVPAHGHGPQKGSRLAAHQLLATHWGTARAKGTALRRGADPRGGRDALSGGPRACPRKPSGPSAGAGLGSTMGAERTGSRDDGCVAGTPATSTSGAWRQRGAGKGSARHPEAI